MSLIYIALVGLLFGSGILISGMADPNKVLNFFDLFGSWDPSLMFVMGGGLVVNLIGYQLMFRQRSKPLMADTFPKSLPTKIDARLVGGSALFGIGWGIAGFCPGAAIPALGTGALPPLVFVIAVGLGMLVFRLTLQPRNQKQAPASA
jgi:uncharacterized protein